MSFFFAIAGLLAAGLALLALLRLGAGHLAVDLPIAWFVGSGWFALAAFALRFLGGVPYRTPTAVALLALPVVVFTAARALRWRRADALPAGTPAAAVNCREPPRWRPHPAWLFAPIAGYVALTSAAIVLHGANTPTHTDDGFRVRAFAPMLAFEDAWGADARAVLATAGPVPTFVPSLGWRLSGEVNHFHVNGVVLVDVLALLVLAVALGAAHGRPERGWAGAFAVLSLPLFVYHCTSTYSDAVLAIHVAAGFLFFLEYGLRRDPGDAARALVLLLVAAMVKREGQIVAGTAAAVLLAQVAWNGRRTGWRPLGLLGLLCLPYLLVLGARVVAIGAADAIPFLGVVAQRTSTSTDGETLALRAAALRAFVFALFGSGNAGLLFWILPVAVALRFPSVLRRGLGWTLALVLLLLAECAASALWLVPEYTVDGSTVHRSLLAPSVAAALWLAALFASGDPRRTRPDGESSPPG